jgi:hypothetical protein
MASIAARTAARRAFDLNISPPDKYLLRKRLNAYEE